MVVDVWIPQGSSIHLMVLPQDDFFFPTLEEDVYTM
jgi:hypothetical protein